jgi:hypothetical protein
MNHSQDISCYCCLKGKQSQLIKRKMKIELKKTKQNKTFRCLFHSFVK